MMPIQLLGIYPRLMKIRVYEKSYQKVHSSFISNTLEVETTQVSTNRTMINKLDRLVYTNRIHKLGIQTVVYSSKRALLSNKRDLLMHATAWMNPQSIMLSDIIQTEKSTLLFTFRFWLPPDVTIKEIQCQIVVLCDKSKLIPPPQISIHLSQHVYILIGDASFIIC